MKEMQFSKAAQNYPPSGIRKMFDLAAKYPDAIKLTVGEPNFDTPAYIKEAAKKAMDAGETHYTPNAGMTVLRQAVAEKYQKAYWDGYTADHVMVTVGAMEGLMLTMMLLLDPGDEILVPDPCFPNYYGQASLTGAQAKPVPTYEENDYRMMAADIEKCITPPHQGPAAELPLQPHRRGADQGGHPGLCLLRVLLLPGGHRRGAEGHRGNRAGRPGGQYRPRSRAYPADRGWP